MVRTPIAITIILISLAVSFSIWLLNTECFTLSDTDIISNLILIFASLGAFISATFVIWSYIHTNAAFILSQKPALLLFVNNLNVKRSEDNPELVHMTQITYKNTTNNTFYDLTVKVILNIANRTLDLSDLFTENMYMAGFDQRKRQFVTVDVLGERGVNLFELTGNGHEALLTLSYQFTFNGSLEKFEVQKYRWETDKGLWSLK